MFDVQGFILVGGRSRRMGEDKAQLRLGSQTVLARIAAELSIETTSVTLVGAHNTYADVLLKIVPDVHREWGALGGIHTALTSAQAWALVVACDLPFVTSQLFARLISLIDENVDAIVPVQSDGRPQPVCAVYRRDRCLPEVEALIGRGEHTPRALLANIRTRYVGPEALDDLAGAEKFFINVNTPEDFERARRLT